MIGSVPNLDPFEKEQQLRDLGVGEAVLLAALARGEAAASACTPHHPPMAPGFYRFSETVCSLADQLTEDGWTRHDYKNFSTVVREDRLVAIAVASGDAGTGDLAASVTTRSPKGITTAEAIAINLRLPYDDGDVAENERIKSGDSPDDAQPVTWFLLHDRRDGSLFAELSCPQSIDSKGYVQAWAPRILLTTQPLAPVSIAEPDGEPPMDPVVNVKRRATNQ
jgi:hypothetical protein